MLWRFFILLGIMFFTTACTVSKQTSNSEQSSNQAIFSVETSEDTTINMDTSIENTAVFDIISPRGIGDATITRNEGEWPEIIMLRFHLNGLENMDLTYTDINIKMEISSHGDNQIRQSVTQDGVTEIISNSSDFWMPVAISPTQGEATIPLEAGTIDVRIPPAFYDRNPNSFTISWIDFYR